MFKYIDRRYYESYNPYTIFQLSKANETFLQRMSLLTSLDVHRGCVNSVVWDDSGELLLSGSDDQQLVVSKPWLGTHMVKIHTAHQANIFSAKFIPFSSNRQIVSCSGDGMLIYTDLDRIHETYNCKFTCHVGTCYDVLTVASDPHSFLSCGEDGTVRWFDLRVKNSCSLQECKEDILLNMRRAVTAIAVNPLLHFQLAVSTQDSTTHIYDRRMLGTKAHDSYLMESNKAVLMRLKPQSLEGKSNRITSLRYNSSGDQVLASYSSDYLYLFDIQKFKEIPLEGQFGDDSNLDDENGSPGPTLKRLRLRGDWSDTGPQAVPESELRNQAGDVGQARPTLHSTLMQRMTDILSRMLNRPSGRAQARRRETEPQGPSSGNDSAPSDENHLISLGDIASDGASASGIQIRDDNQGGRETSSAPPSIASSVSGDPPQEDEQPNFSPFPRFSQPSVVPLSSGTVFPAASSIQPSSKMFLNVTCDEDSPSGSSALQCPSQKRGIDESPMELEEPIEMMTEDGERRFSDANRMVDSQETSVNVDNPCDNDVDESNINMDESSYTQNRQSPNNITRCNEPSDADIPTDPDPIEQTCTPIDTSKSECRTVSEMEPVCSTISARKLLDSNVGVSEAAYIAISASKPVCSAVNPSNPGDETPALDSCSLSTSSSGDWGPSTSLNVTNADPNVDRRSPKRSVPCTDSDDGDASTRQRMTSARVARAIDKVVQRVRGENLKRLDAERLSSDRPIPFGLELGQYRGHRNARTMIKEACFWGDHHVMSGSDCGRVFVWNKDTGQLVMLWEADRHVVNCLQPHPTLPILATSGIDYDVKLWAPICAEPRFNEEAAEEIAKRNEMLLAETRDTVTVPATFMIRMLASLNQLRQDRLRNQNQNPSDEEEEDSDD